MEVLKGPAGKSASDQEAMGQFGRITSMKDLPSDKQFAKYVKLAMKLNEEGVPAPSRSKPKEYVEWITEAKTEETREKRMETAIEWMEEGKSRNWKYQK